MFSFNSLKIKNKIVMVNGLMIALLLCVGYVGYLYVQKLNHNLNHLTDDIAPTVNTISDLETSLWHTRALSKDILLSEELLQVDRFEQQVLQEQFKFIEGFNTLSEHIQDSSLTDELAQTQQAFASAVSMMKEVIATHRRKLEVEQQVLTQMQAFEDLGDALKKELFELAAMEEFDFKQSQEIQDYQAVESATKLALFLTDSVETAREYLSATEPESLHSLRLEFEEIVELTTIFEDKLRESAKGEDEKTRADTLIAKVNQFHATVLDEGQLFDDYFAQLVADQKSRKLANRVVKLMTEVAASLDSVVAFADEIRGAADEMAANDVASAQFFIVTALLLGIVCSLTLGLILSRSITKPLAKSVALAEALAKGDLTQKVEISHKDEVGLLAEALNNMVAQLVQIVRTVKKSSNEVNSAADEIAGGASDLSQRTEEQAASLEQTAASIEQMTATVKQNADNAAQANQLAAGASAQAVNGGKVVENAVEAMVQINQASKKIADIISVIDEIAFQTNLLSLNAAVEAARAGEQGRGFAVVAGEVGKLAQRSADSAKEIKQLITNTVEKVENGTVLVNKSGETLQEIVLSVKKVCDIVSDIAAASEEQSTGIDQINAAVAQMDKVTQLNAASVEETATSSSQMRDMAAELSQQMTFFKLEAQKAQKVRNRQKVRHQSGKPVKASRPNLPVVQENNPAPVKTNSPPPSIPSIGKEQSAEDSQQWTSF